MKSIKCNNLKKILLAFIVVIGVSGCSDKPADTSKYDIEYAEDNSFENWNILKTRPNARETERNGKEVLSYCVEIKNGQYNYDNVFTTVSIYKIGETFEDTRLASKGNAILECIGYQIVPMRYKQDGEFYIKEYARTKEHYENNEWSEIIPSLDIDEIEQLIKDGKVELVEHE